MIFNNYLDAWKWARKAKCRHAIKRISIYIYKV